MNGENSDNVPKNSFSCMFEAGAVLDSEQSSGYFGNKFCGGAAEPALPGICYRG